MCSFGISAIFFLLLQCVEHFEKWAAVFFVWYFDIAKKRLWKLHDSFAPSCFECADVLSVKCKRSSMEIRPFPKNYTLNRVALCFSSIYIKYHVLRMKRKKYALQPLNTIVPKKEFVVFAIIADFSERKLFQLTYE